MHTALVGGWTGHLNSIMKTKKYHWYGTMISVALQNANIITTWNFNLILYSTDCYSDTCLPEFLSCAGDARSHKSLYRCKLSHRMCTVTCLMEGQAGDNSVWQYLHLWPSPSLHQLCPGMCGIFQERTRLGEWNRETNLFLYHARSSRLDSPSLFLLNKLRGQEQRIVLMI